MPLVLLARAVAFLPWWSLRRLGGLIGFLAGSVLRIRRAHVEASVRRAGIGRPDHVARAMYASLGTSVFEFLWMVGRRGRAFSHVTLSERAERALEAHGVTTGAAKAMVIATAHTGNWDVVACASAERRVPLAVITKRLRVAWLDRFWQGERATRGIELLHGVGVLADAVRCLERGRSVAALIDQAPERTLSVTRTSFLGKLADCDRTPALLSARARVPLALALGYRRPDGTHEIDIPLVIHPPPRPSRAWVEEATRRLNDELEAFVRARPSQWLWLHRRWKLAPEPARREVAASFAVC
jgi:KDO2-lipid IV(A) lauroyltransferase